MDIRLFSSGRKFHQVGRAENLASLMSHQSVHEVPAEVSRELQFTDKMLYIYTSGTTGLPKAAVVKNSRLATLKLHCIVKRGPINWLDNNIYFPD